MQTVLVTGGFTGLGAETALYLAERGFRVFAADCAETKRPAVVAAAEQRGIRLDLLSLDIADRRSIDEAVAAIIGDAGAVDGLVNNAGIALRGCLEDLADDELRRLFEVNVLGTMAVTRRVVPHMRAAGRGRIVTISSVGGRIATYGLSAYCATKFAQEGFAEALALEVAPFGLKSILVEPGIVKTARWTENRGLARGALNPASPYYATFRRHEALADDVVERSAIRPADVARTVHRALTDPRPRLRYVVGRRAALAIALRRYLPEPVFEGLYFGSLLRRITAPDRAGDAARPAELPGAEPSARTR